jgi:centromere protein I
LHLFLAKTSHKTVNSDQALTVLSLGLCRQTGGDPNLTGLLRVFKNYYPEIIVGDATKGRAAAFKARLTRETAGYTPC